MKLNFLKYFILFLVITSCKTTKISSEEFVTTNIKSDLKTPFANQGEQELYWAQEHFKKEYVKQKHSRFKGKIIIKNDSIINFYHSNLRIETNKNKYIHIFKNGLIYPKLFNETDLKIYFIEELDFLSDNPKVKRFRSWVWGKYLLDNPTVYLFELTNTKADINTSFENFCKGANLTYFKSCWIII